MSRIYDATLVSSERLSASKFLKLARSQQENIKTVRFIPPRIGRKNDFGSFLVEYTKGFYTVADSK